MNRHGTGWGGTVIAVFAVFLFACQDGSTPFSPSEVALSDAAAGTPSTGGAAPSLAFGPETFTRGTGAPRIEVREVASAGFEGPFTLHVQNGNPDGDGRVTSAWLELDGTQLLGPGDFRRAAGSFSFPVNLSGPSELMVEVAGGKGSFLRIWIEAADQVLLGPGGGTVELAGGEGTEVTLEVPPGALGGEVVLTVSEPEPEDVPEGSGPLLGTLIELGPDGTTFEEPVRVEIPFDPSSLPQGISASLLQVFTVEDGVWVPLSGGGVNVQAGIAWGYTTHFSTFGTLTLARFCPGDPSAFETIQEAIDATIDGGTVEVCDGTHAAEGVMVAAPVTVQPEAGASPVLQGSTAGAMFFVDGYEAGTVVFDGLTFEFSTPTPAPEGYAAYAIRARGSYDQLVVRNSTFTIDPGSRGAIVASQSGATAPAAPAIFVENTSVNGGQYGIAALDTHLEVRSSQFSGTSVMGVSFARTSGRVENSTFEECGSYYCVRATQAGADVEVVSNDFTGSTLTGVGGPDLNGLVLYLSGATGLTSDNDMVGCGYYQCVYAGGDGTDLTVSGNRLTFVPGQPYNQYNAMIRYENGAAGLAENNQITGCFLHCIQGTVRADITVRANQITIPDGQSAGFAVHGHGGDTQDPAEQSQLVVENNTIQALGAPADPADPETYPLIAGVEFWNSTGSVTGNQISGARIGVIAGQSGEVQGGEDNTISGAHTALLAHTNGRMTLRFSDIAGYQYSFSDEGGASDLRCNYWGVATGPASPPGDPAVYTPWATAAIAGTDHSGCSF